MRNRRALVVGVRVAASGLVPGGVTGPGVVVGACVIAERAAAGLSQDQVVGRAESDGDRVG
jgi:hypothetical protein